MKIVADARLPLLRELIPAEIEIECIPSQQITERTLRDADALICRSVTKVDAELIRNSKLSIIATATSGFDHIDTEACAQAGIQWAAAPGCNARAVAEHILAQIAVLRLQKRLPSGALSAVIIGVGHVGSEVARMLRALNITLYYCDPPRAERELGFISSDYRHLPEVDIICLHTPLTTTSNHATQHMIDRRFLQRCKPGTVIMNAGRGAVVNTADALRYGQHCYWCIDVFENEPDISVPFCTHALLASPHIAGHAVQAKWRGAIRAVDAVARVCGFNLPQHIAAPISRPHIDLSGCSSWEQAVLHINDPRPLSRELKQMGKYGSAKEIFKRLRNDYGPRHEFNYPSYTIPDVLKEELARFAISDDERYRDSDASHESADYCGIDVLENAVPHEIECAVETHDGGSVVSW